MSVNPSIPELKQRIREAVEHNPIVHSVHCLAQSLEIYEGSRDYYLLMAIQLLDLSEQLEIQLKKKIELSAEPLTLSWGGETK